MKNNNNNNKRYLTESSEIILSERQKLEDISTRSLRSEYLPLPPRLS